MHFENRLKAVALGAVTVLCGVIGVGVGVSHAGLTTAPSLSVSERYNNNLFLSRDRPFGDLATMVSPRLDLLLAHQTLRADVRYQATGEWYQRRRDQNRWSQQGEVDLGLTFMERAVRGLDVRVGGSLSRAGELPGGSLGDRPPELGDGVRLPRTETSQRRGTVSAGYSWTRWFESRFEYGYSATQYDAFDLVRLADVVAGTPALTVSTHDSTVHDASLGLRYRSSPVFTLSLNPGWSATRVDPVPGSPPEVDTRTVGSLTAGADYSAGPTVALGGRVGAMVVEDDQTRLTADADIQRAWKRGLLRLAVRQGAGTGGGVTNTVSVTQGASADGSLSLGAKAAANVRVSYSRSVSIPDQSPTPTIRVLTYEAGAGLSRQWLGWLTGRLDYSYLTQQAQGVALDAQRHLVTVSLTAQAPSWPLLR